MTGEDMNERHGSNIISELQPGHLGWFYEHLILSDS